MRPLTWLAVALVACGGPDFTGTWRGSVALSYTCTDGSTLANSSGIEWAIAQAGNTLTVTPDGGTCGSFTADVSSGAATLRMKACPAGGSVEGGTLELKSPTLLNVTMSDKFADRGGFCSGGMSGPLSR